MARNRELRSLPLLYAGFLLLVLISQLSGRLLAEALTAYSSATALQLASIRSETTDMAYSACALGIAFSFAVLFTLRTRLDAELRVYRATGLPMRSALRIVLLSHPPVPAASALASGAVAALIDTATGLDPWIPLALALAFVASLIAWMALDTLARYSRRGQDPGERGRVG